MSDEKHANTQRTQEGPQHRGQQSPQRARCTTERCSRQKKEKHHTKDETDDGEDRARTTTNPSTPDHQHRQETKRTTQHSSFTCVNRTAETHRGRCLISLRKERTNEPLGGGTISNENEKGFTISDICRGGQLAHRLTTKRKPMKKMTREQQQIGRRVFGSSSTRDRRPPVRKNIEHPPRQLRTTIATKRRSHDGGRRDESKAYKKQREREQAMQKRTNKQQPTRIQRYVQKPEHTAVRPASSSVQLTVLPLVMTQETNDRQWNHQVGRDEREIDQES